MKNGKKLTAAMTASTVVAAMAAPAAFASVQLNDINGSYAKDAIQALVDKGIINGKGDGNFDPTGLISRQDFAIILAKAAGLDVSSAPATATFSDVPTSSYAFKYVEAAHKAGLLAGNGDGTFGATAQLSRQDMATFFARALKQSTGVDYAGKGASLKFTDSASIADYAKDAVGLAVELGYISGNPDGTFNPKGNAERQAVASVAYRFLAAVDKIKAGQTNFAITTDATTMTVGQKVHFKVDGATSVAWSVSGNGVIDANGDFVANASGAVTVTALVNGSTTITKTVNVYGVASSVTISDIKPVVANKASTQDVTITVVDANGNAVTNFNGTVNVSASLVNGSDKVVLLEDADGTETGQFKVTNGVATVTVVSNTEFAGQTTTLSVDDVTDKVTGKDLIDTADYAPVTKDITTVEQVATAVKVSAKNEFVAANGTNPDTVTAYVVDQDGETMLSGNYGLQYTISGVGTWDSDGDSAQDTNEYDASWQAADLTNAAASIDVNSVMGKTGTITITVASEGLTTGTATIKSVIGQDATKLTMTNDDDTNTDNSFTQGGSIKFTLSALDGNSVPAAFPAGYAPSDYVAYVTDANGNAVDGIYVNDADATDGVALSDATIKVSANPDLAAHAGTYNLVVKDSTKTLAATEVAKIIVNPDAPAKLDLETSTDFVAANNATETVTAQVTDQFGNPLKKAGVPVTFSATNGGTGKGAFNGKTKVTAPQATVETDANGLATATFAMDGYADDTWTFDATSLKADNDIVDFSLLGSQPTTTVKYYTTASLSATFTDTVSSTNIHAGDAVVFNLVAKDANGRDITLDENDQVKVTISNPAALYDSSDADTIGWDSNNSITGTISEVTAKLNGAHAHAAGNVTLTVTDLSVPNAKSASVAAKVTANTFDHFALFDANQKLISDDNLLTVEANKEVVVYLKALDAYGNVTVTTDKGTATLNGLGGQFRKVSGGAGSDSVDYVNGASSIKLYYVNPTADSYNLNTPVAP